MKMTLTDTHCHLDNNKFDPDRPEVLQRAREAGITRILIPGLTLSSSRSAVKLADGNPMLYTAIGVHPTEAKTWTERTYQDLLNLRSRSREADIAGLMEQTKNKREKKLEPSIDSAFNSKVVAIGEIGLDYYWDTAPHDVQKTLLLKQLDLASELKLPVVLHFREKDDAQDGPCAAELLDILEVWVKSLREVGSRLSNHPGVLHSFSGSLDSAKRAIGLHFKLGVTGPVVYSRKRQEIIAGLRLDDLLVETDSPYLSPTPRQGRRNEPANVIMIADKIALLQSCKREEAAEITTANAERLFGWDN